MIRELQVNDVLSSLPLLLEAVERGETLVLKRGGNIVARLVPEAKAPAPSVLNWYKRQALVADGPVLIDDEAHNAGGESRCTCSLCFAAAMGA